MAKLGDIMTSNLQTIKHDISIQTAAEKMRDLGISSLLVEKNGKTIGILTETDIVKKCVAEKLDLAETNIDSAMSAPILSLEADKPLKDAYIFMAAKNIRHLTISENGTIVGMVSSKDLMAYFMRAAS